MNADVTRTGWRSIPLGATLCTLLTVSVSAIGAPMFKPKLEIARASGKIAIDGKLDDAGWKNAQHINQFVERDPGDNTAPEVATEVYVTYDDAKLYIGFVCHDDPAGLRATMSQRDQWSGDDAVIVYLDTYGAAAWAYQFMVNPYGIQKDMLWTSIGPQDLGFDVVWESAAKRTSSGYTIEMAIPFAGLRFPDKDIQSWRIDFWRNRPRQTVSVYSWSANDRSEQCFPCQWGTIDGIQGVHPGKGVEVLPSMVAHQSGALVDDYNPNSSFHNADVKGEGSIGAKYSLSSDITLEGAYNPDFSQIEADATQISVNSTISLMYPERRPFFQEGSDIFQTLFNSFYTRTVNDPRYTAKLTGRHGRTRIGFLSAYDENSPYMIPLDASNLLQNAGKSLVNVLRASRQFGENSQAGFILTDRRFDGGGSGSIASIDGNFRLSKSYLFMGQYIMSHTAEPVLGPAYGGLRFDRDKHTAALDGESYWGDAVVTRLDRRTRHWKAYIGYNHVAPAYRTQTGYDPVANHRTAEMFSGFAILPKGGPVVRIDPQVYYSRRWDFITGVCRFDQLKTSLDVTTRLAQTRIGVNFEKLYERWRDQPFDGMWESGANFDTRLSNKLGSGGYIVMGKNLARFVPAKANELGYGMYLDLKPVDRLTVGEQLDYFRMSRPSDGERYFSGYITRTRAQFQANKALSFRLVVQYDDFSKAWNVDPLMTYRVSPFSVFYLGSTIDYSEVSSYPPDTTPSRWRNTSRQIFMKLQYLFQV